MHKCVIIFLLFIIEGGLKIYMVYIKFHIMLLILHAFTCLCWTGTQAPSARMHAPLSGRHTGTFGTHARASVGQAHRHLRHACTRLCRAGTQAPSARMHAPLSGRHTGTFGTHARASVGQAHRHLRHACTH